MRVTFASGYDAYLRRGSNPNGPIATFTSKKTADVNADFMEPGLDDGAVIAAIPYHVGLEDE